MKRLLMGLLVLLVGCDSQSPEAVLDDYLERIENTLELSLSSSDPYAGLLPLPGRRERRLVVTEVRTGMLETLDFKYCDLLPLIAERNSSLGRVMTPSTLLSYELRFFHLLEECYRRDQLQPLKDRPFSELLSATYHTKAKGLPRVVWNAIFTSQAMERNLSLAAPPLPLAQSPGYGDSLRALDALVAIRDRVAAFGEGVPFTLPPQLEKLEGHYEALHHSEYGSRLISSLILLSHYLEKTAATLESALARRPICFGGPTEQARILNNVFHRYYAAGVLPYMARIQREGQPWMNRLETLMIAPDSTLPAPLLAYRGQLLGDTHRRGLWERYQQSIRRHTAAWQTLLGQCDLMPGGSPGGGVG